MISKHHKLASAITIILVISLAISNLVFIRNFEIARRRHVERVQQQLHWLYGTIERAARPDNNYGPVEPPNTQRVLQRQLVNDAIDSFDVATWGLAVHHNFNFDAQPSGRFQLLMILQGVFMADDDPTYNLQFVADQLYELLHLMEPNMSTRDMFAAIEGAFRDIYHAFYCPRMRSRLR